MSDIAQEGGTPAGAADERPAKEPRPGLLQRLSAWRRRNAFTLFVVALAFVFVTVLLLPRMIVQIPAGHVGVLWLRFFGGTVTDFHFDEGVRIIFPWDEVYIYDARLRTSARTYDTISSNGLSMQVEIAVRYRINRDSVGALHRLIGPSYPEILVYPEIGSHARELISRYTPEQLYTETRAFIQAQILERMVTQLGSSLIAQGLAGRLVFVEDVLIRSVVLPAAVVEAIERKAQQYQVMLEYDFRLAREEKERLRKQIEAQGIRDFQEIVSGTITNEYLRLRGIDATLAIASSRNAKMVIMGGPDGLPVILNTGEFTDEGAAGAPERLEPVTAPPAPSAALPEVPTTSAVQPEEARPQRMLDTPPASVRDLSGRVLAPMESERAPSERSDDERPTAFQHQGGSVPQPDFGELSERLRSLRGLAEPPPAVPGGTSGTGTPPPLAPRAPAVERAPAAVVPGRTQ